MNILQFAVLSKDTAIDTAIGRIETTKFENEASKIKWRRKNNTDNKKRVQTKSWKKLEIYWFLWVTFLTTFKLISAQKTK